MLQSIPLSARLAALVVLVASLNALAQPVVLEATMTNAGEPGGVTPTASGGGPRPASFGNAQFVLNAARTQMTMTATIFNIDVTGTQTPNDTNDNLNNAHIHASATVTPTTNAGVVWGFHGSPQNNTNPADGTFTPFPTGVGGTWTATWDAPEGNSGTTLTAQLDNILNGRSYINFHTTQFGGGEIRGHLNVVPEPATGLLALGAVSLLTLRRRR